MLIKIFTHSFHAHQQRTRCIEEGEAQKVHFPGDFLGARYFQEHLSRAARWGGFKWGCFPIWTCRSFFVLFGTFPIFSGFSRFVRGLSLDFPDWSFSSFSAYLAAPMRNSPERVRDPIWTFPEKSGKPPGLDTLRLSFSQTCSPGIPVRDPLHLISSPILKIYTKSICFYNSGIG